MKMVTKFFGSSLVVGGLILVLSAGTNWWLEETEEQTDASYHHQQQALAAALDLKLALREEIESLKNYLLLDRDRGDLLRYERAKSQVLIHLEEIELLVGEDDDAELLRRRHRHITRLASELTQGQSSLAQIQQDLRALNSFQEDIEFYTHLLLDKTRQQVQVTTARLNNVRTASQLANNVIMILTLSLLAAQFLWILLPVLRSIEQLKQGVAKVRAGDLDSRLAIATGDEIEALGHDFNQMTAQLQTSNQQLNRQMQEIQVARQAAEAANRAKSSFLANMNHELRTPLNGILGYAQILERDATLNSQQLKGVGVIQQCATHLLTLINDVLDISKIEAGKVELHPQDVHFPNFLLATADICRIKADFKGIDFIYDPPADLPTGVRVDDKRLRQVLLNLLSNAIKFTDMGSVTLGIATLTPAETQVSSQTVRLRLSVEDTGMGIPEDKLARIFTPFEQAGSNDRNAQGTGLGLAISQQIVQMMGGEIQVVSQLGRGSQFWFELELDLAQEWQAMDAREVIVGRAIGYKGDRRTILAIDDEPSNCHVLVDMLEPLGFRVVTANTGKAGLMAAQRDRPDLIVTDVMMPEMDGLTMTRQLRQQSDFATTPIIASPAALSRIHQRETFEAGCNVFLTKPIDFQALLQALQDLLGLEWIEETPVDVEPEEKTSDWVVPPPEELQKLHQSAKAGFIGDVKDEAERLRQIDDRYTNFANKLLELAQAFDDEAILDLVQTYVKAYFFLTVYQVLEVETANPEIPQPWIVKVPF